MRTRLFLTAAFVLLLCRTAAAHPGHGGHYLVDGFTHPLSGLDHILAMVAVGLLAVRAGGGAIWAMPAAFVGSMMLGWIAGAVGMPLAGVEYGIMGSLLVFGVLLSMTKTPRFWLAAPLIALFAVFHGHAHATEMTGSGTPLAYAAGFVAATILLHAAGVAGGLYVKRSLPNAMRIAGAGIGAAGMLMLCEFI